MLLTFGKSEEIGTHHRFWDQRRRRCQAWNIYFRSRALELLTLPIKGRSSRPDPDTERVIDHGHRPSGLCALIDHGWNAWLWPAPHNGAQRAGCLLGPSRPAGPNSAHPTAFLFNFDCGYGMRRSREAGRSQGKRLAGTAEPVRVTRPQAVGLGVLSFSELDLMLPTSMAAAYFILASSASAAMKPNGIQFGPVMIFSKSALASSFRPLYRYQFATP